MNTQEIMDSVYILPVLLEHIDNPTPDTQAIIKQLEISDLQLGGLMNIRDLLQYHHDFIKYSNPEYTLLRKGLVQYWNIYLSSMFVKIGLVNKAGNFMDYGCGAGQAAIQFSKDNPEAYVVGIDKVNENSHKFIKVIDFESNPDWHEQWKGSQDWVFMSELLHCKSPIVQRYLIHSAWNMLKPEGELIIVENYDPIMVYRINKIKGTNYKVLGLNDIEKLCSKHFHILSITQILKHTIYRYARIQ